MSIPTEYPVVLLDQHDREYTARTPSDYVEGVYRLGWRLKPAAPVGEAVTPEPAPAPAASITSPVPEPVRTILPNYPPKTGA
jgi:hypothetical protein